MVTALLLAAGRSARLGRPKQLVPFAGEPLVRRTARRCLEAGCTRVLVVEGAVPLRDALAGLPVELAHCPDWARGPGASLRTGAAQLGDDPALVVLADQWQLTAASLRQVLEAPGEVVAARYAGVLGVPARFAPAFTHVLRTLPDDEGARAWLRREGAHVTPVDLPEAEADLDLPAQLP